MTAFRGQPGGWNEASHATSLTQTLPDRATHWQSAPMPLPQFPDIGV
jgi:hypothetical protein